MNNGAFGENFPYSNFHDLNMDWIIKIAKDFLDQYTHIQEIIEQGKTDINNLTEEGLTQLQDKADTLEALLQAWYNTHSSDIANQLTQALADITSALNNALTQFATSADARAQEAIATIPSDYSAFYAEFHNLEYALEHYISKSNLYDDSTVTPNTAINQNNGTLYPANGYWSSYFIPVYEGFSVIGYGTAPYDTINFLATYDADQQFIECLTNRNGCVKIPTGAKYIRICNGESARPHSTYKLYYVNENIYSELLTRFYTADNLFNPNYVTNDSAINTTTGVIYPATGYYVTPFMEVYPGFRLEGFLDNIPTIPNFLAIYDSNYALIECRTNSNAPFVVTDNMKYIRLCNGMTPKPANRYRYKCVQDSDYTAIDSSFIHGNRWISGKLVKNDGTIMDTQTLFAISDYIRLTDIMGYTVFDAVSYPTAQANSIAFYDRNKTLIGTPYAPGESTIHPVTFKIDEALVSNYPGAVYCIIGRYELFNTRIVSSVELPTIIDPYPSFKLNVFHKVMFCGDSVTVGFVCEGTEANPEMIYTVLPDYSYPTNYGRTYPKADIFISGRSGISSLEYYNEVYPTLNYEDYDLIIVELGLNGGLNIADIDTPNTNTWAYKKIIEGIRNQNPSATIGIVRSQHFLASGFHNDVFTTVASDYRAIYIDLHNTSYLNLDDPKYHGYYNNSGTPALDYAHFTRYGYCAKAYVVIRLLSEKLN